MRATDAPLVTFVVPCYNSAAFMSKAVESLLAADKPCEILLVNDGSTDDTWAVASSYAERYEQVKAVDQKNANWGGAVNHGLSLARGTYFKVVDSDDHLEPDALHSVLDTLDMLVRTENSPDLLVTNYVYDHLPTGTTRLMQYRKFFPQGRTFGWPDMMHQTLDDFIMIHACWFATSVLRASGVELPEGVPYMDSILLLHPLKYVKTLYYLDVAPYQYVIGREGQSVNVDVIKRHIDDQLFATMLAIKDIDYEELRETEPNLAQLMGGYMLCMMSVSTLNLFSIGTPEALAKNDALWKFLKEHSPMLYRKVRFSWVGLCNRRTALGRFLALRGYEVVKRIYKLA